MSAFRPDPAVLQLIEQALRQTRAVAEQSYIAAQQELTATTARLLAEIFAGHNNLWTRSARKDKLTRVRRHLETQRRRWRTACMAHYRARQALALALRQRARPAP